MKKFKKFAAFLLAALTILTSISSDVFAASGDNAGQTCTSKVTGYYVGSDGYYYVFGNQTVHRMVYNEDRSFSNYETNKGVPDITSTTNAMEKYQMTDAFGNTILAYCIESGMEFAETDGFVSSSSTNSTYYNLLPNSAQKGIFYALLYGYSDGKQSPVSGTNTDDYQFATQVIIWEYQQQVRTDASSRHAHSFVDTNTGLTYTIPADEFYNDLKGRPAEKCYNWILEQIQNHTVAPTFTYQTDRLAYNNPYTMKYDSSTGKYTLTLTDTAGTGKDIKLNDSRISVSRNGNKYTFSTTSTISTPVCVTAQKSVTTAPQMLIWGKPGAQTLATGASDPFQFYLYLSTEANGTAKIVKTSEDGNVSGIRFTITGNGETQTVTTGTDGTIAVSLLPGTYTITEQTADKYVNPASRTVTITGGNTTTVNFSNILKKFNVTVTKKDSETGAAQGDASLAGAVYGLYKSGTLVEKLTTGTDGKATSQYYACGTDYTIKEITPPEGYELDTKTYTVGAAPGNFTIERNTISMSFTDDVIKGNISIIKHSDDGSTQIETPEEGAVFEIYLKSSGSYEAAADTERDVITTDEYGFAQSKDLPYGTYTVHQTAGLPNREFIKDFDVVISAEKTYRYLINNADFYSYVRIVKTDSETGETVPYAGAGFKIYDPDGNPISFTVTYPTFETIDTFYTSSDGTLITPDVLPSGEGYSIVEVEAPYGYVLNSEPVYFDIERGGSDDYQGINVVTVIRDNIPQKGTITIVKSGEIFASVTESNGIYTPVYELTGLAGAVYEIYAAEDITTPDGTVRYQKGELADTVTTGADGTAISKELYLGKYEIKEINAPYGYVLSGEIYQAELTYAGENIAVTNTGTETYNERQKLFISGLKAMEMDEIFNIGTGDEILDVTFGLYAAEDITAADGSVIPAGGLIEIIKVTADGKLQAAADLPFGCYYLQELSTNPSYVLNTEKYPVEFAYTGQDDATVEVMINNGEAIKNNIFYGSISGLKTDESDNPLKGAVFGLFDENEADLSIDNALMTAISDDDGVFIFDKVPCGTYQLAELEAPEGYLITSNALTVTVTQNTEAAEVKVVNEKEEVPPLGDMGIPIAILGVAAASAGIAVKTAPKKRRKLMKFFCKYNVHRL